MSDNRKGRESLWAGVFSVGKTDIHFCKEGLKINAKVYQGMIRRVMMPQAKRISPTNDWIFQQDSAPAHWAKSAQDMRGVVFQDS